jgi:hypothetical protein
MALPFRPLLILEGRRVVGPTHRGTMGREGDDTQKHPILSIASALLAPCELLRIDPTPCRRYESECPGSAPRGAVYVAGWDAATANRRALPEP